MLKPKDVLYDKNKPVKIKTHYIDRKRHYMANKVCRALGTKNHSIAVHRQRKNPDLTLEAHESCKAVIHNDQGKRVRALMVDDGGLYKLIQQARGVAGLRTRNNIKAFPDNLLPDEWRKYLDKK